MAGPVLPESCDRILLDADAIASRVRELGAMISHRHAGEDIRLLTVLRGGLFFLADLCRAVDADVKLDFLAVASYLPGQGGAVRVTKDLDDSIEGASIILVEDVVDTGLTVNFVLSFLKSHRPASLELCALFDKPARRIAQVDIDYLGFEMPDRFLVGYGLDVNGAYRNLPFVATLRDETVFGQ
jgi:hypoxanthine phosphoribosyltransferase